MFKQRHLRDVSRSQAVTALAGAIRQACMASRTGNFTFNGFVRGATDDQLITAYLVIYQREGSWRIGYKIPSTNHEAGHRDGKLTWYQPTGATSLEVITQFVSDLYDDGFLLITEEAANAAHPNRARRVTGGVKLGKVVQQHQPQPLAPSGERAAPSSSPAARRPGRVIDWSNLPDEG